MAVVAADGKPLASFEEYVRVMKPSVAIKVGTSGEPVSPGHRVVGRLENLGTTIIQFEAPYAVEYFNGVEWVTVGPSNTVWPRYVGLLAAGAKGDCMSFDVPLGAIPGQYRFVKRVEAGLKSWSLEEQRVYGIFTVAESP
jgi:hypothetical protein